MTTNHDLKVILSAASQGQAYDLVLFSILNLGLIESLTNGLISATDAVKSFYTADNCLFVRKLVKNKTADAIMSHGVQLPDLFDCLPVEEAQREFLHELSAMK